MESGNVLLSQAFPHVLDPPLAAHMGEPNQVQCRTFIEDDQRVRSLPGDIVPLFRPQGAGDDILTKYILRLNQRRPESRNVADEMKKEPTP